MFVAHLKWIQMLFLLGGVLSGDWNVDYQHQNLCAARGSSVFIPCSFTYPEEQTVQSVMWAHERSNLYEGPFIYDSQYENRPSRFQYTGDKKHNCSLKILHVQNNDTGKYAFRFKTSKDEFTGPEGSTLKVVDLKIFPTTKTKTIKEGDSMNLSCIYSCEGDHTSEITWVKDGRAIHEGPELYLKNLSSTHSGNYSCFLKGHTGTATADRHIDVEYGPQNTSVSVTPSAELNSGSNVTLICRSHAKPPVENYTWFKIYNNITTPVGHEPEHHIMDIHQSHGGQYFCSATNKHGSQNSSVVTLKVKEIKVTFHRNIVIIAALVIALLAVIVLVSIRRLYKKKPKAPKTECEVDTQNPIYANWSKSETQEEFEEVTYAAVTIKTKTDTVKKTDPPDEDECVIYSAVCRM